MIILTETQVQEFLDSVLEGELIKVRFFKKDGSVADYEGVLDVGANHNQSVAINTDQGWKRFNLGSVISIEKVK